jgi:Toastrack DUF4097
MKTAVSIGVLIAAMWLVAPAYGQEALTVNFSDPSRPGLVKVNIINGGIVVKAHSRRDVIIEGKSQNVLSRGFNGRRGGPPGLRRIDNNATGLTIEEENNVMTITTRLPGNSSDIEIQVPARTNLSLRTMNGGDIVVEGVEGEIEVTNMNGGVVLNNVAGSMVAHSANGRVLATLREITTKMPMSFSSMNGNVDITLPSNAKANLKMRTDNGATWSDFEMQIRPNPPTVEDSRNQRGRLRIQTDKTLNGTINGGGLDVDLRTLNGNIYIRKGN